MVVFGFGTALAAVLSNDLGAAVANLWFGGVLMAAWVMPLRAPLLLVMFVGLAVDRPGDAEGHWASPLITVGGLLFQNLNNVIGVEALKFSGVALLLACLLMVRVHRLLSWPGPRHERKPAVCPTRDLGHRHRRVCHRVLDPRDGSAAVTSRWPRFRDRRSSN